MKNLANNIEDLLEILAGLHKQAALQIESSDATIMYSIARQTFKGTALTDKQHALMKEKLQNYRDQFIALDHDFDQAVESLRQPLRQIDRSKYIKIVDTSDIRDYTYESYKEKWKWIKIRFPFSKKLIMLINSVSDKILVQDYKHHEKGSHEHFFVLDDRTIKLIMDQFSSKEFDIDQEIIDQYNKIKDTKLLDFYPTYYNGQLLNITDSVKETILADTNNEKFKIADRRHRYGIDVPDLDTYEHIGVETNIVNRIGKIYQSNPKEESFKQILDGLMSLDRFPLVVVLEDRHADSQLYEFWDYFRYKIPTEEQAVMFRLDNNQNSDFNQFVKDKKLNNIVDKNTKVVYINKVNKVVIRSGWNPIAAFAYSSSIDRVLDAYLADLCDLIVFREENISPMRRYSRYYGKL